MAFYFRCKFNLTFELNGFICFNFLTIYLSVCCFVCYIYFVNFKLILGGIILLELKDTIELMGSDDFKERFVAEYLQTKIRYDKLFTMLSKYKEGTLNFTPKCSYELLFEQATHMGHYLHCLEVRAEIEGIKLPDNGR